MFFALQIRLTSVKAPCNESLSNFVRTSWRAASIDDLQPMISAIARFLAKFFPRRFNCWPITESAARQFLRAPIQRVSILSH
jgi:hypothetical protein